MDSSFEPQNAFLANLNLKVFEEHSVINLSINDMYFIWKPTSIDYMK
jgi:hypothetical protein